MIVTHDLNADVTSANLYKPLLIAQDDTDSHVLITQLAVNDVPLDIPNTYTAKLNYELANGDQASVNAEIENGKVKVAIPDEALSLDDRVNCDITVLTTKQMTTHTLSVVDGELISTPTTSTVDVPLRTALFYIDSKMNVIGGI